MFLYVIDINENVLLLSGSNSSDFVNHFIQYFESNEELQSIIADMSVEDVLSNMLK